MFWPMSDGSSILILVTLCIAFYTIRFLCWLLPRWLFWTLPRMVLIALGLWLAGPIRLKGGLLHGKSEA